MNIGVIGLGYVGLTLALVSADCGITTYGTEINEHIKRCIAQNHAHFYEPGLDDFIRKHNNTRFFCVDSFPRDVDFDAFIVTVGTPLEEDSKEPNIAYIKSALASIEDIYTGEQLVILRSTVSVGTTRNIVIPFLSRMCGRPEKDLRVAMCPERTVEGKAMEELKFLPQILSGNNRRAVEMAREIFTAITPYHVQADSLESAELAKLFCNTYRDMSFALGNVLCVAAQSFGVDGTNVIRTANEGYPRSNIALPGFVAGPCLEKDAYILASNMRDGYSRDFILGARRFNERMEDIVVTWLEEKIGEGAPQKTVVLSGMAFKGKPVTSDLRGSSSVYIARKLKAKGYSLRLHDYAAQSSEMRELNLGEVYSNLQEACTDAHALLILNNHERYARLEPSEVLHGSGIPILDAWGVCLRFKEAGIGEVYSLGNICISKGGD